MTTDATAANPISSRYIGHRLTAVVLLLLVPLAFKMLPMLLVNWLAFTVLPDAVPELSVSIFTPVPMAYAGVT
jgi:hypothetical protein